MRKKSRLVYGVGVNDADYVIQPTIDGKLVHCSFYHAWVDMLKRCHSEKYQANHPTYIGCTVCDEWLIFSNFKSWMDKQDWKGKELCKDLLLKGNKVYSPDTCVFVDSMTNTFTNENGLACGQWPIGVDFHKVANKFRAQCRNPFTGKKEHLGYFACKNQAHLVWKKRKHELALQLADLQTDERVANALRSRYA